MNVNKMIIEAMRPVCPDIHANVRRPDENGKIDMSKDYIVFNYVSERPVLFGDDTDIADETDVDVHLFTQKSQAIQKYKRLMRKQLRAAGFSIISTYESFENDTKYTHIVVSVSIGGDVEE